MANALGQDITGKTVMVEGYRFKVNEPDGGFGAVPFTAGRAVFGVWVDGPRAGKSDRVQGEDIIALADEA